MYDYRKMPAQERAEVVASRRAQHRPWHAPPHFQQREGIYFIFAACFEHRHVVASPERRDELQGLLLTILSPDDGLHLLGWVILPNHYHLLLECDLPLLAQMLGRLHNRTSTRWNREDETLGRKVWHRFADRAIRSERHQHAALNYLHFNPVKHGHVADASEWRWSSLSAYLEQIGRETLVRWWKDYPIDQMGKGWDD